MDARIIESVVVGVLKQVQELSGEEYVDIEPIDTPLGNLDGFDSLKGIETTVMIEQRLGCTIKRDSLFVTEDGRSATTLAEICEDIREIIASGKKVFA